MEGGSHPEEDVVGGGFADGDADPVGAVGADHDALLLGEGGETGGVLTEGEPHEVALRVRDGPAAAWATAETPNGSEQALTAVAIVSGATR
jgi:hypothetical protein